MQFKLIHKMGLLAFVLLFSIYVPSSSASFLQLSPTCSVNWQRQGENIVFDVVCQTRGWIALGCNNQGSMIGASMIVFGVENNQKYCHNLHAVGHSQPLPDSQQNCGVLKASQSATHTSMTVSVPVGSGEGYKCAVGKPLTLLWAYGDQPAANMYAFNRHSSRGFQAVTL